MGLRAREQHPGVRDDQVRTRGRYRAAGGQRLGETALAVQAAQLSVQLGAPKSSLLILVSAFAGLETVRTAYRHALGAGYRVLSFGDAMFLERSDRED